MVDIDITQAINDQGELFQFEYSGYPEFEGLALKQPLKLAAEYSVSDGMVRFNGMFDTMLVVECTRCLTDVGYEVKREFNEVFTKDGAEDSYRYDGSIVKLDRMIYDYLILSLPQQILCSTDCKGICQKCGVNLNEIVCDCSKIEEFDENNPFNKLKNLF